MPECTPTTENIRHCYIYSAEMYDGTVATPVRIASAEFDRWLAAHDREVAARTLERAAARLTVPVVTEVQLRARAVIDVELLFEADRIRSGTEGSTS